MFSMKVDRVKKCADSRASSNVKISTKDVARLSPNSSLLFRSGLSLLSRPDISYSSTEMLLKAGRSPAVRISRLSCQPSLFSRLAPSRPLPQIHSNTAVAACSNRGVTTTHEKGNDQLPNTSQSSSLSLAHRSAASLPPAARHTAHITGGWKRTKAICCNLLVRGRLRDENGRARRSGRGRRRERKTEAPKLRVATMEMVRPPRRRFKHLRRAEVRAVEGERGAVKMAERRRGVNRRARMRVAGS